MFERVVILLRARLAAQRSGALLPVPALLMQALITATMCGLVRDATTPFSYALVALTISGALITVPLLSELSYLLSADEAADWVRALPVRASEIHLARTLHLVIALAVLSAGSLIPAALIAPSAFGFGGRVALVALGLGQALTIAAALLLVQALLRGRAQTLLVLLQTALFVGVVVGLAAGLRAVPQIAPWRGPFAAPNMALFPPAWFAAGVADAQTCTAWQWRGTIVGLCAIVVLFATPAPPVALARRGEPILGRVLAPVRALAGRWWVRGRERAMFEFAFDALPKERDFVIRAYPLVAVPVAFLFLGARGEAGFAREALLALLFFAPAAYVPLLAVHAPVTRSYAARWLLDTAPVDAREIENGALKAIAVRFLLPLYVALAAIGIGTGAAELALELALPAWLVAVLVLRKTWRICVTAPPLSTAPDDLYLNLDWMGLLGGLGIVLTFLALFAAKVVDTWPRSLAFTAVLVAIELIANRKPRDVRAASS